MITIECRGIQDLMVDLAVYIAENVAAVPAIKTRSIVLDPLTDDIIDANNVSTHVKAFLAEKGLSRDFMVKVVGEKITVVSLSVVSLPERKVSVEKTDSGLLVCPHCGKVTPYEEEMNVHVRAHYFV